MHRLTHAIKTARREDSMVLLFTSFRVPSVSHVGTRTIKTSTNPFSDAIASIQNTIQTIKPPADSIQRTEKHSLIFAFLLRVRHLMEQIMNCCRRKYFRIIVINA